MLEICFWCIGLLSIPALNMVEHVIMLAKLLLCVIVVITYLLLVYVVDTIVVADIVVVGYDIKWDPTFENFLADLSRRNLDDSSSLDYKC